MSGEKERSAVGFRVSADLSVWNGGLQIEKTRYKSHSSVHTEYFVRPIELINHVKQLDIVVSSVCSGLHPGARGLPITFAADCILHKSSVNLAMQIMSCRGIEKATEKNMNDYYEGIS